MCQLKYSPLSHTTVSKRNTYTVHHRTTHQNRDGEIKINDNDKDAFGEKVEVSDGEEEDDGACDLGRPEILDLSIERLYMLIEDEN